MWLATLQRVIAQAGLHLHGPQAAEPSEHAPEDGFVCLLKPFKLPAQYLPGLLGMLQPLLLDVGQQGLSIIRRDDLRLSEKYEMVQPMVYAEDMCCLPLYCLPADSISAPVCSACGPSCRVCSPPF